MERLVDNKESINIILQIVAAIVIPVLLVSITGALNKRNRIEEQTFEHKRKIFEGFLDLLLDYMNIKGTGNKLSEKERERIMLKLKKQLILYASEKTLEAFNSWILSNLEKTNDVTKPIKIMDKFLYQLRIDLGLNDISYKRYKFKKYHRIQVFINEKFK